MLSASKTTKTSHTIFNELHYYIDCADAITNEQEKYEEFDILDWWKLHEKTYLVISNIVRYIFTPLVSTEASEYVFSVGGRVLTK